MPESIEQRVANLEHLLRRYVMLAESPTGSLVTSSDLGDSIAGISVMADVGGGVLAGGPLQQFAQPNTWYNVLFDIERIDNLGMLDPVQPSYVTIRAAGTYLVLLRVWIPTAPNQLSEVELQRIRGASTFVLDSDSSTTGSAYRYRLASVRSFQLGDLVKLFIRHTAPDPKQFSCSLQLYRLNVALYE